MTPPFWVGFWVMVRSRTSPWRYLDSLWANPLVIKFLYALKLLRLHSSMGLWYLRQAQKISEDNHIKIGLVHLEWALSHFFNFTNMFSSALFVSKTILPHHTLPSKKYQFWNYQYIHGLPRVNRNSQNDYGANKGQVCLLPGRNFQFHSRWLAAFK